MKKIFLSAIILCCFGLCGKAQNTRVGVKGGINVSSLNATGNGGTFASDSKIGFYAGAVAQIGIAQNFAFEPEIMYSLLGARYKYLNVTIRRDLGYIAIPLLVAYVKEGLSLVAGPQISFLISAKDKGSNISADVKDGFNTAEFSGVVGVGYTTLSGFGFDARYQLGLSDIQKGNTTGFKLKNNNFQFGIHYLIHRY
ncbi:MAG: porin family protein [Ginsengibacter sp.]